MDPVRTNSKQFSPMLVLLLLIGLSPLFVTGAFTFLSFALPQANTSSYAGLIYLLAITCSVAARALCYYGRYVISEDADFVAPVCTVTKPLMPLGSITFSAFVFAFTIGYLVLPMCYGELNIFVILGLVAYFVIDMSYRFYSGCYTSLTLLFINILMGAAIGAGTAMLIIQAINPSLVYFYKSSSTKDICYRPKDQTFKCQVYKDGVMVGNI